jgi:hypothetical protein
VSGVDAMLEVTSYGLTGLVAILLVAFCLACKDDRALFSLKSSFGPISDAELCHPKPVERYTGTANSDTEPQGLKHEGALHG